MQPIRFDDVADLYDVYVTTDIDIAFFLREAQRTAGRVLELMCGTGRVSLPLLRAGVDLTCVDYAPNMLARLQEKLQRDKLTCTLVRADVAELSLPERFDLILIPFNSFQEIIAPERQRSALGRIAAHLAPPGRFICTLQNPPVRLRTVDGVLRPIGSFPTGDGGGLLDLSTLLSFDRETRIVHGYQEYQLCDARRVVRERRRLDIAFRLYTRAEFEAMARGAGFSVRALYGDYTYAEFDENESPFMLWELALRE